MNAAARLLAACAAVYVVLCTPAAAHHSASVYFDLSTMIEIERATLTRLREWVCQEDNQDLEHIDPNINPATGEPRK